MTLCKWIATGRRHRGGRCMFVGWTNILCQPVKRSRAIPFPRKCSCFLYRLVLCGFAFFTQVHHLQFHFYWLIMQLSLVTQQFTYHKLTFLPFNFIYCTCMYVCLFCSYPVLAVQTPTRSPVVYRFIRPVQARERCRISPPRFLAECCTRQLNRASFVLLYFRLFTFSDLY